MEFQQGALKAALEEGFSLAGFCRPNPRKEFLSRYQLRREQGGLTPFDPKEGESRLLVEKHWPFCRSILSLGVSYNGEVPALEAGEGSMSRIALGKDYHLVVSEAITRLVDKLKKEYPGLECTFQVDNGPLSDRASAWESGLGFFGKNGFVIHPEMGSFLNLAQVFTNMDIEHPGSPMDSRCGLCNQCIKACPTQAMGEGGMLDANKCISYLTQKKGILTAWERKAMGSHLYGCDICQDACPFNAQAPISETKALLWDGSRNMLELQSILSMDKGDFAQNFGQRASGWRGRSLLQRNALVVCGNLKSDENRDLLMEHLKSPSQIKRIHAMFSLENYGESERILVREELESSPPDFRKKYEQYR